MPALNETLGLGEIYPDPSAWEAALDNAAQYTGSCKAEAFNRVSFAGVSYSLTNHPHLTSVVGAQHDARAHEVSGKGNARFETSGLGSYEVNVDDPFVEISWLEMDGAANPGVSTSGVVVIPGNGDCSVHHCLMHTNHTGNNNAGISSVGLGGLAFSLKFYRNISYGYHDSGIEFTGSHRVFTLFNTCYENDDGQDTIDIAGILINRAGTEDIVNTIGNACFDNNTDVTHVDFNIGTLSANSYNATSDASADDVPPATGSLINLVTADQFMAPDAVDWTNTDLRPKSGSSLLYVVPAASVPSAVTYPEINVSADARGVVITGDWTIGAVQHPGDGQEINITGDGVDILNGDATPSITDGTDFGLVSVGVTKDQIFIIENLGASDLNLTDSPAVTLTGDAEFTLLSDASTPVAAAGSEPFTIRYTPTSTESNTASISIANNDSDENPYTFNLSGGGLEAEINITGNDITIVSGDITPSETDGTDFGNAGIS